MLLVAIGDWPYGYYQFLRLVVCASAIAISIIEFKREGAVTWWLFVFSGIALLFNPIATVHLDQEIWQVLDLFAAVIFLNYAVVTILNPSSGSVRRAISNTLNWAMSAIVIIASTAFMAWVLYFIFTSDVQVWDEDEISIPAPYR